MQGHGEPGTRRNGSESRSRRVQWRCGGSTVDRSGRAAFLTAAGPARSASVRSDLDSVVQTGRVTLIITARVPMIAKLTRLASFLLLACIAMQARAQLVIEITRGQENAVPVAIVPFG